MADAIYPHFKQRLADGAIDLDSDTFRYCLMKDTYVYNKLDRLWANISASECSAVGYTAAGTVLTCTWTRTGGTVKFDATDPSWTAMTGTARSGVIVDTTAASSPLVCYQDFAANKSVSAGTFTVIFNVAGIFTLV